MELPVNLKQYFTNLLATGNTYEPQNQYDLISSRIIEILSRKVLNRVVLLSSSPTETSQCLTHLLYRFKFGIVTEQLAGAGVWRFNNPLSLRKDPSEFHEILVATWLDEFASQVTMEHRTILIVPQPELLAQVPDSKFGNLLNRLTVKSRLNYYLGYIALTNIELYQQYIQSHAALGRHNPAVLLETNS